MATIYKTNTTCHLTIEIRREIERLKKEGKSHQEIASALGIGKTTVRAEMKRCSGAVYSAEEAHATYKKAWEQRREKFKKIFSEEEIKEIRKMMENGSTRSHIRRTLRMSHYRIEKWFLQEAPHYKGGMMNNLEARLSNIEQQIEILFDLLKENK